MKKIDPIDRLYGEFAIFFFSTLFLIVSVVFQYASNKFHILAYFSVGLFALFYIGYFYLIGRFIEYYLNKTIKFFKHHYPKYKLFYWLIIGLLMLLALGILGYIKMDRKAFWGLTITTLVGVCSSFVGSIIRKIYRKYKKK